MMTSCEYALGKSRFVFEFHTPGQLVDEWVTNLLPAQTLVERKARGNSNSFFEAKGRPVNYRGSSMYINIVFVVGQIGDYNETGDTFMQPRTGLIILSGRNIENEDIALIQSEAVEFLASISATLLKTLPSQMPQIERIREAQRRNGL